jgi:ABC-type transport system substrate-binding protein
MQSYWNKVLNRRLSRRRAIIGSSALTASAAFLAACGGDDDDDGGSSSSTGGNAGSSGGSGSSGSESSGLVYKPEDTTSKAKAGGKYITTQDNAFAIAPDPHKIGAHASLVQRAYSQLFRIKHGVLQNTDGEFMGDVAQSWELSPDHLTLTIKLEPEAGFAPIDPLNGRKIDAEDVTFSWRRMIDSAAQLRGDLANEISPDAPIVSVDATDASTVVIKMAAPNATIYTLLAHNGLGSFWMLPKEAGDTNALDIGNKPIGTGPYYVSELQPESRITYKKNPNFKRSTLKNGEPYIDEIDTPIILEAATRSAQFRAGAVYETAFPRLEMVGAKNDQPDLLMYVSDPPTTERVYFGQNPDSPFIDERMRQAYYRVIDRDAFVRAAYDVDFFEKEGLSVEQYWEGSFEQASWQGWVLDPKSVDDYGDAQKNFVMDLAEAKKLVEAAGQETPFNFAQVRSAPGPTSFSQPIYDRMQIIEGMLRESGVFTFDFNDLEWATEWVPQVRASGGKFSGASWGPDTSSFDPATAAFFVYHPSGGYFEGGDDHLAELALKIRAEFDVEKRKDLVKELQRYDAKTMFNQKLGVAPGFALAWPVVRNVGVFHGGTNWLDIRAPGGELKAWIDPTQAPLKQ